MEGIFCAPLSNFAQERRAVPGWEGERACWSVSELNEAGGDGTSSFTIGTGAQNDYAHSEASGFGEGAEARSGSNCCANSWVRRCSSKSASARNLHPQLMKRRG